MNPATATDLALEDQVQSTAESQSFEADIASLSSLMTDCVRSTDCFLSNPINRGKASRFRINRITVGLLVLNVALTLVLNLAMLNAGANTVQLLISNAGLMILHLLASICIASDLARGKTHFLNERAHLAQQFHELSDHMSDMLRERQKWVDALIRCKWSRDAEQLKIQLAAQEVEMLGEKVLSEQSKLSQTQAALNTLNSQQTAAQLELQRSVKEREAALAESNKLRTESETLKSQFAELNKAIQEAESVKQSKLNEIGRIEDEIRSQATKQSENEKDLATLQQKIENATASLSEQKLQHSKTIAEFESKVAELIQEQSKYEASIQAFQTTQNDLKAAIDELQTQFDSTRNERETVLAKLEQDIATSESTLISKQSEIGDSQTKLGGLAESLTESDQELTRICGILDELNSKNEYAQVCNVQLVNESISLDLKCNQQRESLAGMEAEQVRVQLQIDLANATLDSLRNEEKTIQSRIENLMQVEDSQAIVEKLAKSKAELDLELAAVKNELQEINTEKELAQQNKLQLTTESATLELKTAQHRDLVSQIETALTAIQLQLDEKNASLNSMRAEELKLENRIANLLTQASKFDCLAVATSESHSYAQEQELSEQSRIVTALEEQKASLERTLLETQAQINTEKATAKQICEEATQMQADAQKSIADAERRVEMLSEKAQTLVDQVQNRSAELYAIKQEMIELRAEVRDLEATSLELKEVEQELEGLKSQLTEQRAQMDAITTQIAEGEATYDAKLQLADAIGKQIANLESQLQLISEQCATRTQTVEQLAIEQDAIVTQNQQLAEQKDALEFAISSSLAAQTEVSNRIAEFRAEEKSQREQITQLEAERTALESDLLDLTSTVQLLHAERNQLEGETEQLRELAGQRSAMEEELANISANIDSLTQQQATAIEMLSAHEQSSHETEMQLNTLRHELTELEQQRAETIAAQTRATQELADTAQLQQSASEQLAAEVQQTEAIQKRLRELQSQLDSLTNQQNSASATLQKSIDEVNDAQAVAKQWGTYIDSLKLEVESQRRIQSELQLSIEALRKGESQAMIDMERATCEVESLLEQQASLRTANQSEEIALRAAQRALDEAIEQRAALQHDLLDKQRSLEEITNQLADANTELRTAEASVNAAMITQSSLASQIFEGQTTLERIASDQENHLSRIRDLVEEQEFLETSICGLNKQVALSESVIASLDSRKYELESELRQQQAAHEIAADTQTSLEARIATLNAEIAALETKKSELGTLEADCNARTETLNALCEESVLEQSRINNLKEQITAAQQVLIDLQEQQADTSAERARLEQETFSIKQVLQQVNEELQDKIEAKDTVEQLIEDFNRELKRFAEERVSVEKEIEKLSEHLNAKLLALQATQDETSVAESKALELWSTISELQSLGAELDKSLNSKRESIGQANAELIQAEEMWEATLAQKQSLEKSVAELTARLHDGQHSKIVLDREIATLTAELERIQIEVTNAETELELLANKVSETSAIAQSESVNMPEPAIVLSTTPASIAGSIEITVSEATSLQESDEPILSQEEDIWTSLGEIARLGDVVGIDSDSSEMESSRSAPSKPLEAVSIQASPEVDAWETVFSPLTAQRRT